MLPYALAIAVGLSSSFLFLTAFFFKDIHRQDDFFWSGIGLFYALVLWFCASSIRGAVLLGQLAVVSLLIAYFWQVIKLRDAVSHPEKRENLDSFSIVSFWQNLLKRSPVRSTPTSPGDNTVTEVAEKRDSAEKISAVEETTDKVVSTVTTAPKDEVESLEVAETKTSTTPTTSKIPETYNIEAEATVSEEKTLQDSETLDNSTSEQTQPSSADTTKEILDKEQKDTIRENIETISEDNEFSETEPEAETETSEIAVETVSIVEEETNWDDDVDDIPSSSVKIIKEVPKEES